MKPSYLSLITYLLLMAISCTRPVDKRLEAINTCLNENPRQSIDMRSSLDSIDSNTLSESDKTYKDLLTIKIRDLNLEQHPSDSLIKRVLSYVDNHQKVPYYCEALYYGGRVYYDMGDYPTSLSYYQNALDALSTRKPDCILKGKILCQMADLLNHVGMFSEAISYLEEAIKIDRLNGDSLYLMYDLSLLGTIQRNKHDYETAQNSFIEANHLAQKYSLNEELQSSLDLAYTKYENGEYKEAEAIMNNLPDSITSDLTNYMLAIAAQIYLETGNSQKAYVCARHLIEASAPSNRYIGYKVLLSPGLINKVERDSILTYVSDYRKALESHFKKIETDQVIIQNSRYNYSIQARERASAEKRRDLFKYLMIIISMIGIVALGGLLWYRHSAYKNKLNLMQSYKDIERLKIALKGVLTLDEKNNNEKITPESIELSQDNLSAEEARDKLTADLLELYNLSQKKRKIEPEIMNSTVFSELHKLLEREKNICQQSNSIWSGLETVILSVSPDFKSRVHLLMGNISEENFKLALLIRCGFTPSDVAILLGKQRQTITYRRRKLCKDLFGEKISLKMMDSIIRLL